jgi:hypothetical protein
MLQFRVQRTVWAWFLTDLEIMDGILKISGVT